MARKLQLALCEIDLLRAALAKQGINLFDPPQVKQALLSIEAALNIEGLASSSMNSIVQHFQTSPTNKFSSQLGAKASELALHQAARSGDLLAVMQLVASGSSVNEKDLFSSTPLHMAAMYGHKAVAEFLINKGAELNAKTQKLTNYVFTPLDLAALYSPNAEIITYLLNKGAQPDHWDILVFALLEKAIDSHDENNYKAFELALSKMEIVSQNKNALWVYSESEVKPVLVLFKILASDIADAKYYDRIMQTINHLTAADKTFLAERYVAAKNLLHAFPSDEIYTYKIGPNMVKMNAEGYYSQMTVELAAQTLGEFRHNQDKKIDLLAFQSLKQQYMLSNSILESIDNYTKIKLGVFYNIEKIFKQGANTAFKAGLFEESEALFSLFEQGETIILPSGWDGHAIEIILEPDLNLFMVANSGQRFEGFPSGLNAYNMHFDITPEIIHTILNNHEQLNIEFQQFYDLGLERNESYSFLMPAQLYGNCAWYSQQIAQKALLYIEIQKAVSHSDLAFTLASNWFEEYNEFHLTYVLKEYLSAPFLEEAALGDILLQYHKNVDSPGQIERAHLMLDTLSDSAYIKQFQAYMQEHLDEITPQFKSYIIDNGFKILGSSLSTVIAAEDVINWHDSVIHTDESIPAISIQLQSLLPALPMQEEQTLAIL